MSAYYNENDEDKAAWLRELIRSGIVAAGEVDTRSISEVWPEDLAGFSQHHFFAGIGVWSYALRLAGWPDDRPVWTGSCPCPSFSAAGKGGGFNDPRHLWPAWARLIRKCKPATIFGEQADDAIGYGWLDLVQTDLERENYAVGKAVLGACSVGAPHIRQRLYFLAHSAESRFCGNQDRGTVCERQIARPRSSEPERYGCNGGLAHSEGERCGEARESGGRPEERAGNACESGELEHAKRNGRKQSSEMLCEGQPVIPGAGETFSVGDSGRARLQERQRDEGVQRFTLGAQARETTERASYVNGFWRDADWVLRKRWNSDDWEWCPTEPGTFPLVTGATNRVLKLRGYGDAICAPLAQEFIEACLEAMTVST